MNIVPLIANKTLFGVFGIDPAKVEQIYPHLIKPLISLSSTGISKRNYSHWKKEGLFENTSKERTWVKLNLFEFLWLRIIEVSRDFGIAIPIISEMKKMLDLDVLDILQEIPSSEYETLLKSLPGANQEQTQVLQSILSLANEMGDLLSEDEKIYKTIFSSLIGNVLLKHKDVDLVYYKEGPNLKPIFIIPDEMPPEIENLISSPHLKIPLRHLIENFFDNPETEKFAESFGLINHYERKVLDILQSNEFQEIRVYNSISKHDIILVPTSDLKRKEFETKKLFLLFGRNQYKKIVIHMKDKKEISLKNKLELLAVN